MVIEKASDREEQCQVNCFYRMTYKFNSSHNTSLREDGRHVHTFRLGVILMDTTGEPVDSYGYEEKVKSLVDRYRGKNMNDAPEFADIRPTIENICIYFYNTLKNLFESSGRLKLIQVTLGDSPTQSFSVSEDYIVMNRPVSREKLIDMIAAGRETNE